MSAHFIWQIPLLILAWGLQSIWWSPLNALDGPPLYLMVVSLVLLQRFPRQHIWPFVLGLSAVWDMLFQSFYYLPVYGIWLAITQRWVLQERSHSFFWVLLYAALSWVYFDVATLLLNGFWPWPLPGVELPFHIVLAAVLFPLFKFASQILNYQTQRYQFEKREETS